MIDSKKALKSGVWYTVANFFSKGIIFISTPIFTRLLSHEQFGQYNNFASWLSIFIILITLNIESTYISAKYDFKHSFDKYVFSTLFLSSISALIWLLIFLFTPINWEDIFGLKKEYIYWMVIYLIFFAAVNVFQVRERYLLEYKKSVFVSLLVSISTMALSVLLVYKMEDRLCGRIIGSLLPTMLIGLFIYMYLASKGKRIEISHWKYALPIALPYIPHLLSMTVLNSVDKIMITKICGAESNALYSIAYTCGNMITILITSLNSAYVPWLGEKLHTNKSEQIKAFSKRYIAVFVYFSIGIMLIAPELLLILGGDSYMEAKYVMPPVAMACVCQFLYTMYVNVEQFKKKTLGMALASVSAAILNYVLNYFFIPRFGYIAGAYTTLASFIWLLAVHVILVQTMGLGEVYDKKTVICMTVGMSIFTLLVNVVYQNNNVRFAVIGIYIGLTVLACVRHKKELINVKNMIIK